MARFAFKGLEEYELKLSKLSAKAEEVAGKAIYSGAKVVADEIKESIENLPERTGFGTPENPVYGVTRTAKEGLIEGFGITPMMCDNGFYNVKLGFDGYNKVKTKTYPKGQPNQLVARGIESGTSWLRKTPFVSKAVRKTKKKAIEEMNKTVDEEINKIMK